MSDTWVRDRENVGGERRRVSAFGTRLRIQKNRGEKPRRWRKSQKIFGFFSTVVELV